MTTENDAIFQNAALRRICKVPLNCAPRLAWWWVSFVSGASVHCASATSTVSRPSPTQTARQLAKPSNHVSGEPTITPPNPPIAITSPFISGRRAAAKCCANALNAAPRHTDTPTPISRRPTIITPRLCAAPNTQMPSAANNNVAGRHPPRAEMIEQHAGRNLRPRETEEIQDWSASRDRRPTSRDRA